LCQVWLKLAQWFWRRFLNDHTQFLHFCDYLPLEEDLTLYLNKLKFPLPKDNVYQVWLNLARWFWRRRFFLKIFSVFLLFLLSSPLGEGQSPSFEQTWIPSPKEWFMPSLVKIGPADLEKIFKWPHPFWHFWDYLPLEEDLTLYLNKLEFLSPKDNVYQVWLNLVRWFWRRFFLKIFSVFLLFCYYLPLENGNPLHLNKLESPPPPKMICGKFG
jgi:hypothetical protein